MVISHGQRALVFEFDSMNQRAIWFEGARQPSPEHTQPPAEVSQRFAGILRGADILTEQVLIPDSHLLDGALFLHHGPDEVRALLARSRHEHLGLSVIGRDPLLAECLRKMVLGSNPELREGLAVFECSALAVFGLDPRDLAEKLSKRGNRRLLEADISDVAKVVAAEFEAAHHDLDHVESPSGIFEVMAHRWNAWIDASAQGRLEVRLWSGSFDMAGAFARRSLPVQISQLMSENNQMPDFIDKLKGITGRSSLLVTLGKNPLGLHQSILRQVSNWWSSTYFDALALQHACSWLRLTSTPADSSDLENSHVQGTRTLQFKGELIEVLSRMPAYTYASARYSARKAISRWCQETTQQNSDGLAYSILKFDEPLDQQQSRRNLWRQVGLTLGPALVGALVSLSISAVAGIWIFVLTALGALLTTPIGELVELYSMRSKKMKAFINIPGPIHD